MNAIGLIETIGYVAAIEASDACVKSANVNIVSLDKVGAGIVTLTICGDVGAVKSAVEAGEFAASRVGTLRSAHIIPRMDREVSNTLFKKEESKACEVSKEETVNEVIENSAEITNEVTEEKIDNSNNEQQELLEQLEIDEKIEYTSSDKENLSKHSVKELKAMAKKLDSSITYKELNKLKKDDLINLVKKLRGEDK